jgi:hypothetical protein
VSKSTFIKNIFLEEGNFETLISKNLYWVPMCQLGPYNANNQRRTSLLDSIIYFIDNNFEEYNDTFNLELLGNFIELLM